MKNTITKKIPASFIDPKKSFWPKCQTQKNPSDPAPPVIKICEWGPWEAFALSVLFHLPSAVTALLFTFTSASVCSIEFSQICAFSSISSSLPLLFSSLFILVHFVPWSFHKFGFSVLFYLPCHRSSLHFSFLLHSVPLSFHKLEHLVLCHRHTAIALFYVFHFCFILFHTVFTNLSFHFYFIFLATVLFFTFQFCFILFH